MAAARRRRRRRPVLPLLALVVTALVVGLRMADGSSGEENAELAWLDEVRPVVAESNQLGVQVVSLRQELAGLDRPSVSRRLDRLAGEASGHLRRADQLERPDSLREPYALLLSTLAIRAQSLAALRGAVDAALGTGPAEEAVRRLSEVGRDLLVADRTYELFVGAAPRLERQVTIPSRWIARAEDWEPPDLAAFVATLRSSRAPGTVYDVAVVTVGTDPPPVGREGDLDVFPFTRNLRLSVVVANVGNEPAGRVTVVASVTRPTGEADTARQFVELAPGQRQVVQIGGLRPTANEALVLSVRAEPLDGESSVSDNQYDRQVLFR